MIGKDKHRFMIKVYDKRIITLKDLHNLPDNFRLKWIPTNQDIQAITANILVCHQITRSEIAGSVKRKP